MAPDIKAALKEAKAGIKDNDFEKVIKFCKIVLKNDRNNYQALVMFARACQEQGKFEDSKKALLMASTVDSSSPVSWQGLATLYDLQPQLSSPEEAVKVYGKLVELVDSGPKHISFMKKLAAAYEGSKEALLAADTYLRLMPLVKEEDKNAEKEIAQCIVNILSPLQNTLPPERLQQLLVMVKSLLSDSVLGSNETNFKMYISLTHKCGNYEELLVAASKMSSLFRTAYPLEWIARVFVERHVPWLGDTSNAEPTWSDCETSLARLMAIYPATLWGNLACGVQHEVTGDLSNAIVSYSKACNRSGTSFSNSAGQPIIWWRLLLEAYEKSRDWPAVESTATRIDAILSAGDVQWPGEESADVIRMKLMLLKAKALMQIGHERHYCNALSILRKLKEPVPEMIVECLLFTDLKAARCELESLGANSEDSKYDVLFAKLLFLEKNNIEATTFLKKVLEKNPNNIEGLILLGKIHQADKNDSAALSCLLRAAKLDSTHGKTFLYLGHHYRRAGDKTKACKCYLKAYTLAPMSEEEGASLSDIYRELGEYDKNFALLNAATKDGSSGGAWAWLRMGLHHLSVYNAQKAISALQRSLQLQHNNRQALESLGDAYLARGSYVAAQKVYEKLLTIDPEALYPRCQIAKIHLCVGEPLTSVSLYENVLHTCFDDNLRSVALLGLAQAHAVLASTHASTNHLDNTLRHCEAAIKMLDEARELQPNSVSVWKLLGDACSLLNRTPYYLAVKNVKVPARLVKSNSDADELTEISVLSVLQLSSKCYGAAVKLSSSDSTLWHDLGLSFYLTAQYAVTKGMNEQTVTSLTQRALNCLKKSLTISPLSGESWDTLGVIATHSSVNDRPLAQHAFIRSIQLQPSPSNWTHLGALYLVCNEINLAHEAFSQAQALEPKFVTCWTGQALIAESVQHYDAADLFRHCCTLGIHPESCLGHAHHVTLALTDKKKPTPSVVSLAADAMMFYSREYDDDPAGLNLAGLSLEYFGMSNTALKLYDMALIAATQLSKDAGSNASLCDAIRCNYGRALTSVGRVNEAAQQLSSISEPDFQSECILALACLKGEDYETGYAKYMSSLHWLAQNHHHKANVFVALACLQYKFGKAQEAKTLLFESCQEGGGCVAGIVALGALGLVEGDSTLITAALNELIPYRNTEEAAHHVTFLTAAQAIVKGQINEAKNILSRAILYRPHCAQLWRFLSWHLATNQSKISENKARKTNAEKLRNGIVSSAAAATVLSQSSTAPVIKSHGLPTQDGTLRVWGHMRVADKSRALKEAQKSLLMHPGQPEAWATLVAAANAAKVASSQVKNITKVWSSKCSPSVQNWLQKAVPV